LRGSGCSLTNPGLLFGSLGLSRGEQTCGTPKDCEVRHDRPVLDVELVEADRLVPGGVLRPLICDKPEGMPGLTGGLDGRRVRRSRPRWTGEGAGRPGGQNDLTTLTLGRMSDGRKFFAFGDDLEDQLGAAAVDSMWPSSSRQSRSRRPSRPSGDAAATRALVEVLLAHRTMHAVVWLPRWTAPLPRAHWTPRSC